MASPIVKCQLTISSAHGAGPPFIIQVLPVLLATPHEVGTEDVARAGGGIVTLAQTRTLNTLGVEVHVIRASVSE